MIWYFWAVPRSISVKPSAASASAVFLSIFSKQRLASWGSSKSRAWKQKEPCFHMIYNRLRAKNSQHSISSRRCLLGCERERSNMGTQDGQGTNLKQRCFPICQFLWPISNQTQIPVITWVSNMNALSARRFFFKNSTQWASSAGTAYFLAV